MCTMINHIIITKVARAVPFFRGRRAFIMPYLYYICRRFRARRRRRLCSAARNSILLYSRSSRSRYSGAK